MLRHVESELCASDSCRVLNCKVGCIVRINQSGNSYNGAEQPVVLAQFQTFVWCIDSWSYVPLSMAAQCASSWGVAEVKDWLQRKGHGHLSDAFEEQGVDGETLLELNNDDLKNDLGVARLPDRKKVLKLIEELKECPPSGPAFDLASQTTSPPEASMRTPPPVQQSGGGSVVLVDSVGPSIATSSVTPMLLIEFAASVSLCRVVEIALGMSLVG